MRKNSKTKVELTSRYDAEAAALLPAEILHVNASIPDAVSVVLSASRRISEMRDEIERRLTDFPIHRVDELEGLALATLDAHSATLKQIKSAQGTLARGQTLRRDLIVAAKALVHFEKLPAQAATGIPAGGGAVAVGSALRDLAEMFRAHWSSVNGNTSIARETVDEAAVLAIELLASSSGAEAAAERARLLDLRARLFTMLARWYAHVRRALLYLRGEGEENDPIAPSMFQRTVRPKKRPAQGSTRPIETPFAIETAIPETPALERVAEPRAHSRANGAAALPVS